MLPLPSRSSELDLFNVGTTCSVMSELSPHSSRAWFGSALPPVIAVSFEHCLAEPSTRDPQRSVRERDRAWNLPALLRMRSNRAHWLERRNPRDQMASREALDQDLVALRISCVARCQWGRR